LLWFGQTISLLGDRVYSTVLPFLIFSLGGTSREVGIGLVCFSVPQLLFVLVGGVVVDRFSRRSTMLISDIGRGAVLVIVAALAASGGLSIQHLYVLSALLGGFSAFFLPAATSIVPKLVPAEQLLPANALRSLSLQFAGVVGPVIGGSLALAGRFTVALSVDVLTYAVSAATLLGIAGAGPMRAGDLRTVMFLGDVRDGFRVVFASQWLWVTIALASLGNVMYSGALSVALPALARQEFGGAGAYGVVVSCIAAGSVLAALGLGWLGRPRRRGIIAYAGIVVGGLALASFGVSHTILQVAIAAVVLGGGVSVFDTVWHATLQELVPGDALGRVSSIDLLGSFGLLPIGYLAAGMVVAMAGPSTTLIAAGLVLAAVAVVGLLLRSIRSLD